ncbi:hypothetical protein SAMN05444162_3903 [Paenibacillaceae bacterium GAS479]|nr:hypothetical protein SAMN05444162_3903 [Paenibacillaceae bacterium GAS479]
MKLVHHPSREEWSDYAAGSALGPERIAMEQHLAGCNSCLGLFMEVLEAVPPLNSAAQVASANSLTHAVVPDAMQLSRPITLPSPGESFSGGFAPEGSLPRVREAVLRQLAEESAGRNRRRRRAWARHPAFHYGLAATLTVLLLLSGTLGELTRDLEGDLPREFEEPPAQMEFHSKRESWSSKVVGRTSAWLHEWQSVRFK